MEPPETGFAGEAGLESTKSQTAARVKGVGSISMNGNALHN
jgi:hypothetical protein